jgi:hypothetical protein
MADPAPAKPQKSKPPGLLSGVIFLCLKTVFISLMAGCVLLLLFFGEFLCLGKETTLLHAQYIVSLNNDFIGHRLSWLAGLSSLKISILSQAFALLIAVTEIIVTRFFIFLLSMPLFVLFMIIFMTDGLVAREIRKFRGARESTFIFHRAKLCMGFSFFVPLFIYLSLPVFISPMLFLITQSLMLSISAHFAVKYFKKYL